MGIFPENKNVMDEWLQRSFDASRQATGMMDGQINRRCYTLLNNAGLEVCIFYGCI